MTQCWMWVLSWWAPKWQTSVWHSNACTWLDVETRWERKPDCVAHQVELFFSLSYGAWHVRSVPPRHVVLSSQVSPVSWPLHRKRCFSKQVPRQWCIQRLYANISSSFLLFLTSVDYSYICFTSWTRGLAPTASPPNGHFCTGTMLSLRAWSGTSLRLSGAMFCLWYLWDRIPMIRC